MSSAVVRRRRFTDEERRQFVAAWGRSGLSQSEFARRAGIAQAYVSRWSREQQATPDASALVPVRVVDDTPDRQASASEMRIRVAGAEITLASGFDRKALADVLSILETRRC
ncbi:MAG: transposase [Planctomycetes bacterium]|nr:transposase [Planctomycetota bacterium]MBK6940868.1 transposase [Planctomycetota bacterium]